MVLPSTGELSASAIAGEFGAPPGYNIGAYRVSQTVGTLSNLPLDSGIPQSGSISYSNFRGKSLNVVVDIYSAGLNNSTRINGRSRYDNGNVTVIGGFRSRPSNSSGCKVFLNVNVTLGSGKDSRNTCALRTGSWDAGTTLSIDIGSSGALYGAGGNGGGGGGPGSRGNNGNPGTSALGIEYSATINNGGVIRCGYGGGGGGGGGAADPNKATQDYGSPGGGGGGGAGFPAGNGGPAGGGNYGGTTGNTDGNNGSLNSGGGGGGGASGGGSSGGRGGDGGSPSANAQDGRSGSGNLGGRGGGSGGENGFSITYNAGVSYTVSGNAVGGTQSQSGVN